MNTVATKPSINLQEIQNAILPADMKYEDILDMLSRANNALEQVEAYISVLKDELRIRLDEEQLSGKAVGNWGISKATRLSFKTTLEEAQALAATKEVPDPAKLKKLLAAGVAVPGVSKSEYIMVRQIEKEKAA